MPRNLVILGIVALVAGLGLTACTSTKDVAQDSADYQNLQGRADRLTMANQADQQSIKNKDAQIAALNQELADTKDLVGSQGDVQKKLLTISGERNMLKQQLADSKSQNAALQDASVVNNRRVNDALDRLKVSFKNELANGSIIVRAYRGTVLIEVTGDVTFAADSSTLKPEFESTLRKLADIFKILPEKIVRVEGHTATFDNDNEHNSWELGATRAITVTRFLQSQGGIDPQRMVVISFGKFWPDGSNSDETHRVKNRVVTFSLLDKNFYSLNELTQISNR